MKFDMRSIYNRDISKAFIIIYQQLIPYLGEGLGHNDEDNRSITYMEIMRYVNVVMKYM